MALVNKGDGGVIRQFVSKPQERVMSKIPLRLASHSFFGDCTSFFVWKKQQPNIPQGVTMIPNEMFRGCSRVKSIIIVIPRISRKI